MPGTLGELKLIFSANPTNLEKALGGIQEKFNQTTKKIESGAKSLPGAFNNLNAGILGVQAALGSLAGAAIVSLGAHLVNEFAQAERQARVLESALNATGRSQAFDPLIENATQLQRQLSIDGDALTEATGRLAAFNKSLSTDELKKSQTAIIALSTALHVDLSSAAFMVEKSLGGTMNMLGRYGIRLDMTKDAHGRLNQIIEKTATMLEVAKEQANTTEGRVAGLNQAWGDMQEVLGQVIAQGIDLNGSLKNTTDTLNNSTDAVNDNRNAWVRWVQFFKALISTVVNGAGMIAAGFAGIVTSVTAALNEASRLLMVGINNMITFVTGQLNSLINRINPIINQLTFGFQLPNLMTPQLPAGPPSSAVNFTENASKAMWGAAGWFAGNVANDWAALGKPIPTLPKARTLNIPGGEEGADGKKGKKHKEKADKELLQTERELSRIYEHGLGPLQKYNHELEKLNKLREEAIKKGVFKAYGGQALFDREKQRLFDEAFGSLNVLEKINPTKPSQDAGEALSRMMKQHKEWMDSFEEKVEEAKREGDQWRENNDKLVEKWKEAQSVIEDVMTPLEKYNETIQKYNELAGLGYLNQEQFNAALQKARTSFVNLSLQGNYAYQQLDSVITRFGQTVEDTFVEMFQTGSFNFSKLANSVISEVIRMGTHLALLSAFGSGQNGQPKGIFTNFIQGLILPKTNSAVPLPAQASINPPIKGFASGGIPPVNLPSLVGERGPELFIPRTPGTILNNRATRLALAGGSDTPMNITHQFVIQANDARGFDQLLKEREGWFRRIAVESVQAAYNKRGQYGPLDRR